MKGKQSRKNIEYLYLHKSILAKSELLQYVKSS